MKKLSLKDVKNAISRDEMKSISGGYSWLYCWYHTDVNTFWGHTAHGCYRTCRDA